MANEHEERAQAEINALIEQMEARFYEAVEELGLVGDQFGFLIMVAKQDPELAEGRALCRMATNMATPSALGLIKWR